MLQCSECALGAAQTTNDDCRWQVAVLMLASIVAIASLSYSLGTAHAALHIRV
jgi:hypothetical protein